MDLMTVDSVSNRTMGITARTPIVFELAVSNLWKARRSIRIRCLAESRGYQTQRGASTPVAYTRNTGLSMTGRLALYATLFLALLSGCADSEPANTAPVIDRFIVPEQVDPGATVELQVLAHDSDGDALTYVWEVDDGELESTTGQLVKWTVPTDVKWTNVRVYVNDGTHRPRTQSKEVEINIKNEPPVITEIVVLESAFGGSTLEVFAKVSDPDGDALSFKWHVEDGEIDTDSSETVNWTAPIDRGSVDITLTLSDGLNKPVTKTTWVNVVHSLIIPGEGAAGILLGDKTERIEALYGEPEDRAAGGWFYYREIGLTFKRVNGLVTDIFIDAPNPARTEGGTGPGSRQKDVLEEFGDPEKVDDGGASHWYWKQGIEFSYDGRLRVESVYVFEPIGSGRAAPAAVRDLDAQKRELRRRAKEQSRLGYETSF